MTRTNDTGKTLSLIDLTKIPALIQALDHLGNNLMPYTETIEGYRIVGKAYQVPARYGVDNRLNGETSVDLRSFLAEIRNLTPDLAGEIAHAIKLIDEAVLYHQNDEYVPQSGGLSIMSPSRMTIDIYDEIGANAKITPGWDSFFAELLAISAKDTEKPTIITSESGFVIEDPTQTAQVYAEYYYVDGEDFILLGDEPLAPDESGMYTLPEWDGLWFYLQDRTNSENYALLGMVMTRLFLPAQCFSPRRLILSRVTEYLRNPECVCEPREWRDKTCCMPIHYPPKWHGPVFAPRT
jgi:hypothetical protein